MRKDDAIRIIKHLPAGFLGGLMVMILPRTLGWKPWPFSREDWFVLGGLLVGEIGARSILSARRRRAS